MKTVVFSTFNNSGNFIGLTFEMIEKEVNAGNEVIFVTCLGSFRRCGFNTEGFKYMCKGCSYKYEKISNIVDSPYTTLRLDEIIDNCHFETAMNYLGDSDVRITDRYEDYPYGQGVYSAFISKKRKQQFNDIHNNALIKEVSINSIAIYIGLMNFIINNNIKKLLLFNGRWDYYRAALHAARKTGVEVEVFEIFRPGGYYEYYGDNLPHIIENRVNLIDQFWDAESDETYKFKVAKEFYTNKRRGAAVVDKSYTLNNKGSVNDLGLPVDVPIIALFNSSDDEFAAIGDEYKNPFFESQTVGIEYLVDLVGRQLLTHCLIVRMHPNLSNITEDYVMAIKQLRDKYPNVKIVYPEDDLNSYELMDRAEKVITFGSTIGLEASYWGKPVILLGKTVYTYHNVAYIPKEISEIKNLLATNLSPKSILDSSKYGYYFMEGGKKSINYNYKFENNRLVHFYKGVKIHENPMWIRIMAFLEKIFKAR